MMWNAERKKKKREERRSQREDDDDCFASAESIADNNTNSYCLFQKKLISCPESSRGWSEK